MEKSPRLQPIKQRNVFAEAAFHEARSVQNSRSRGFGSMGASGGAFCLAWQHGLVFSLWSCVSVVKDRCQRGAPAARSTRENLGGRRALRTSIRLRGGRCWFLRVRARAGNAPVLAPGTCQNAPVHAPHLALVLLILLEPKHREDGRRPVPTTGVGRFSVLVWDQLSMWQQVHLFQSSSIQGEGFSNNHRKKCCFPPQRIQNYNFTA